MADLDNYLAFLLDPDQNNAKAIADAMAQRLRGQQDIATIGQLGGPRSQGIAAQAAAQAKQGQDLLEKAGVARLHYGPQMEAARERMEVNQDPNTARFLRGALAALMPEVDAGDARAQTLQAFMPLAEKIAANRETAKSRAALAGIRQSLTSPQWDPDAVEMAAQAFAVTGKMPQLGLGNQPLRKQIGERAAQILKEKAGGSATGLSTLAGNEASYGADKGALNKLQANREMIGAFEGTAQKNIKVLEDAMSKIPDTGSPLLNKPVRSFQTTIAGDPAMSAFHTALQTVQVEAARILTTVGGAGQLSDTARKELQDIIQGNATIPQMRASLATLRKDFANRLSATDEQIQGIKARFGGATTPAPSPKRIKVDAEGNQIP